MKVRKLTFLLLTIFFSLFVNTSPVSADVAIPTAKSVSIKVKQDYPDYDFYYCEVPVTSVYNQGRKYTYHYDDTQILPVKLTADSPFPVPETILKEDLYKNSYSGDKYIFAVRKDSFKDANKLKNEFVNVIKKSRGKPGIYFFKIDDTEENFNFDGRRNLTYTIEKIDKSELKPDRKFDEAGNNTNQSSGSLTESEDDFQIKTVISSDSPNQSSSDFKYIGAGFGLTGLILILGILFVRRSSKNL